MERAENRIYQYIRESITKVNESIAETKKYMDENVTNFDKKLNDYRSQVLWRIKDCEELLKSRVATQELND